MKSFITALTERSTRATIVSMEDRKRAIPHDNSEDSAPPLKRQATNTSSSTQLPQSQDDVVHFQKEAIYRQMLEYKRERNMLQQRADALSQQSVYHDEHLRIVDAWWDQLLDEVRIIAGQVEETGHAYDDGLDTSPFPTAAMFEDVESFGRHLSNKRNEILDQLTTLFKAITVNKPPSDQIEQLQSRLAKSLAAEKRYKVEIEQMAKETEEVNSRLTEATIKYMTAEKKMDRMRSQTVQKIERQAHTQPESKKEITDGLGKDGNNDLNITERQFADVERARNEAIAVTAKQKSQLEELQRENLRLSEQVTNIALKLGKLSEEDISSSDAYKNLKVRLDDVISRLNHLEAENTNLRKAAERLEAERTEFKENLLKEQQAIMNDLQNQLLKAEQDLTRIRCERNELHEQLSRKNRDEQKLQSSKEPDHAELQMSQIGALEAEVERLKAQLVSEPPSMDVDSELSDLSHDQLIERYVQVEKQYKALSVELPALEQAYKRTKDSQAKLVKDIGEKDSLVTKLTAEKMKSDQKYFAAARARDTLQSENRVLKNQNSKSSEIIAQLKDAEKSVTHLMSNLEKQMAEMKNIHGMLLMKNKEQDTRLLEQNNNIESLKRQVGDLTREIKSRDGALAKESSMRREVELEAEKLQVRLDEKTRQLETARSMRSDNDSVDILRSIALCPVCNLRWKEMALRTCGHVFCKECVDERITLRQRKCPGCNLSFSNTDMFRVYLGIR